MSSVELVLRLLVAGIFITAGAGKLLDLQGSRDTMVAFGVPESLSQLAGTLLPVAELLVAVALLPTASARVGAIAATVLLVLFTAGVGVALSQGRTPDCNCFGVVSSEQISSRTVARNAVLILVAAFTAWKAPGSSLSGWTQNVSAANIVAALAVLMLALTSVLLLQLRATIASQREQIKKGGSQPALGGLPPGAIAPAFELRTLGGGKTALADLQAAGNPIMLVFASQTCGPCNAMLPELVRWNETLDERITFALIESGVGNEDQLRDEINSLGRILTLVEKERELSDVYQVTATPTGVLIGSDGRIAAPQKMGAGNIEGLVRATLNEPQAEPSAAAR
jgi:thiol-disulfide isomerase/thioredoxin